MDRIIYQLTFTLFFACISWAAVRRSSSVSSESDFAVANRSLRFSGVSWVIIGTLVGGVSTIGTVQTAYTHGIAAWIFTLGSGISCLLLGLFFARGLREEGVVTVSEYLGKYFGKKFRFYSSAFNSAGMFIHIIGQFLASIAILQSVFHFPASLSILLTTLAMGLFVVSGGVAGAGLIGKIKFFLLYMIMIISAATALYQGGGLDTILAKLPQDANLLGFGEYGVKPAVMHMVSMIIGVLSTQIYLQAIFSARDVREARNGAFLSAAVIPPIGILGIIIGLYLRGNFPELGTDSAQALPFFLFHSFPPVIAAFFSAGILLIVLGTGSGLVLGVTVNLYNDFLKQLPSHLPPIRLLRLITCGVLLSASVIVFTGLDSAILKWSYMSMGLRGSAVFAGLCIILFIPKIAEKLTPLLYLVPILYIVLAVH